MADRMGQVLRHLLHYNPETGKFTWLVSRGTAIAGNEAGTTNEKGYIRISINKRWHQAHRLAWLYQTGEWPPKHIDHVNGDPSDNRWKNLRLASRSQNMSNMRRSKNNTSGYKGVSFKSHAGKWAAYIKYNKKTHHLGYYDCPKQAHEAYMAAAKELFGEFARSG